ncbi:hypothetical protein N9X32_08275, partial [Pseudomonadales bacterium]|nr:hypothetical protein [Pseudomonadales bacterium]
MRVAALKPQLLTNRLGKHEGVVKNTVPLWADGFVEIEGQAFWFQPKDPVSVDASRRQLILMDAEAHGVRPGLK